MRLLLLLSLFAFVSCGFEVVDTGRRGVKTTFGKVDEQAGSLPEGLHFYNPFTSDITELNVQETRYTYDGGSYTKDMQQVSLSVVFNVAPDSTKMHQFYREIGKEWFEKIVPPIIAGNLKEVIGQYDAVTLVAQRARATREIQDSVKQQLAEKNITLLQFELADINFNDEFEQAIERKVVAVQKAEEAKNRTVEVEEKAKQSIIAAKAEAESMKIRSQALKENKGLVEYEAVQKWSGQMPTTLIIGGGMKTFQWSLLMRHETL